MMRTDDPAHDWDVYCAEQEEAYAALIDGKTCRDCAHCELNPYEDSAYGWCTACEGFTCLDDLATDLDCEDFE